MRNRDYDEDDDESGWQPYSYDEDDDSYEDEDEKRSLLSRALGEHPVDRIVFILSMIAVGAVFSNALWFQPGPHPAPIIAMTRPVPVPKPEPVATGALPAQPRVKPELVKELQRELIRRGLYEGDLDGKLGAATDIAIRDAETLFGMKETGLPSDTLLARLKELSNARKTATAHPPSAKTEDPIAAMLKGGR